MTWNLLTIIIGEGDNKPLSLNLYTLRGCPCEYTKLRAGFSQLAVFR
jgi:hypothetical protein